MTGGWRRVLRRLRWWLNPLALAALLAALFTGCASAPPDKARQTLIGAYAADGAGAAIGEVVIDKCCADAVATAQRDKALGQSELDSCKRRQSILSRVLHVYTSAVATAAQAVDAYEKIAAKDYSGALVPLEAAGVEFLKGLTEAGVKLPIPVPGAK